MARSHMHEVSITGSTSGFTLEDLRWLVTQATGLPDDAKVTLRYDAGYDQRDPGSSALSINMED